MTSGQFGKYLVRFHLDMGNYQAIFVFPFVYTLLLLWSAVAPRRERLVLHFCELATCCLALFYATAFFHPQYFSWIVLFLVILRAHTGDPVLRNVHYVLIALFVPYTLYWREALWGMLLSPLDAEYFAPLVSPWNWMKTWGSPEILVNVPRSVLSAVCFFLVAWILADGRRRLARAHGPPPGGR
jgi:hypothetical protein